ncbi:MAG: VWA domain-containing protein [Kiritimatiellia bacterium]
MFSRYDDIHDTPFDTRHILTAFGAVGLSLLLHFFILRLVADWRLNAVHVPKPDKTELQEYPTLHVTRLESDPLDPMKLFDRPADRAGVAGSGSAAEVDFPLAHVGELAREPDRALTAPPAAPRATMAAPTARLAVPEIPPTEKHIFVPRQKILSVVERRADEDLALLPRREIPVIERVDVAPDYVPPAIVTRGPSTETPAVLVPARVAVPSDPEPVAEPTPAVVSPDPVALPGEAAPSTASETFSERPGDVEVGRPLDDRLQASLTARRYADEPDTVYFCLSLDRRDSAVLPVAPKDLLFVQDCSRSLAPERLAFCRKALREALATIGPQDRFNVAGFSDSVQLLFPGWTSPTPQAIAEADAFIDAMKCAGETDIYASLDTLLNLPRDPQRPFIVLLVTDGRPTVGSTASTSLIGDLSRDNDGAVSIFTLGTHANANSYLLDMLAYCNRGESKVVATRRWDIPKEIAAMADGLRRPVLSNVRFHIPAASEARLFPRQASNLYADRPLRFFGSVPASEKEIVVQVRGQAIEDECDVILQLPLDSAKPAPASCDLRDAWARQRMYDLIGDYARTRDPSLLSEMRDLSRRLRIPIPYQNEL